MDCTLCKRPFTKAMEANVDSDHLVWSCLQAHCSDKKPKHVKMLTWRTWKSAWKAIFVDALATGQYWSHLDSVPPVKRTVGMEDLPKFLQM